MMHGTLQSPAALLFVPLVLGYVGIAICIVVLATVRWLERSASDLLPAATARERHRMLDVREDS